MELAAIKPDAPQGRLVLVSAINPTPPGEGKTSEGTITLKSVDGTPFKITSVVPPIIPDAGNDAKDGGSAAWLGDGFYALKGANTQEFWQYFPAGDSWVEQETLPAVGSTVHRLRGRKGSIP